MSSRGSLREDQSDQINPIPTMETTDTTTLTAEQISIMRHTANRAAMGLYCGGGPAMDALVEQGLMVCVGRKGFCPDPFYGLTPSGRSALRGLAEKGVSAPGGAA